MKKGIFFIPSSFRIRYDHKVNEILIQHGLFSTENLEVQGPKKKRSCRSFQYPMSEGTVDYIGGKRIGPTFEAFPSNPEKEFLFADQELLHLIWVLSRKSSAEAQKYCLCF